MLDHIQNVYEEQLVELPAINQEALKSFDWQKKLFEIARKYGLHIDQTEDFWTETMLVLVGLEPADGYEGKLMTELAIAPADAVKITTDINAQIFGPIHDFIVRGGPVIEKKSPTPATTNSMIEKPLADQGIDIMTHPDEEVVPEKKASVSFSPLIQTGIVIPMSGNDTPETVSAPEPMMQTSLTNMLEGKPTPTQVSAPPVISKIDKVSIPEDDAIISLESMLNMEEKSTPPSAPTRIIETKAKETKTSSVPMVPGTPLVAPSSVNNQTREGSDKRSGALEKLQKMLADERTTKTVVTPKETIDHTLGSV